MEINTSSCWICGDGPESKSVSGGRDCYHLSCTQCGEFKVTGSAVPILDKYKSLENVGKLSRWIHRHNLEGEIPMIYIHMPGGFVLT